MSQNRENEFENLFKRAADNYPINSSNADWQAVLSELEKENDNKKGFFLFNKKYLPFIVILIAVCIASSLITGLIVWNSSSNKKNSVSNEQVIKSMNQQNSSNVKRIAAEVYDKVIDEIKKNTITPIASNKLQVIGSKNKQKQFDQKKSVSNSINALSAVIDNSKVDNNNKNISENNIPPTSETTQTITAKNESVVISIMPTDSTGNFNLENSTAANKQTVTEVNNDNPKTLPTRIVNSSKYFYAGILFARDKSSIKLEPNKGSGYSIAMMLGYHFSKKWSVETGIHIEKKELYTNGANFDKSILNATGNIIWIESEAKLLEIPITLKRDLFQKKKHSLFTTFGLSSYLVNKETVEYEEEIGGVFQNERVILDKNTSNIFSTFNLSLGYQYSLGKFGNIRLEPYFNIPIGVIGNSKSPVYSKGVFLGWTFDFHKYPLKR
jgi:hypothetical protein